MPEKYNIAKHHRKEKSITITLGYCLENFQDMVWGGSTQAEPDLKKLETELGVWITKVCGYSLQEKSIKGERLAERTLDICREISLLPQMSTDQTHMKENHLQSSQKARNSPCITRQSRTTL